MHDIQIIKHLNSVAQEQELRARHNMISEDMSWLNQRINEATDQAKVRHDDGDHESEMIYRGQVLAYEQMLRRIEDRR